ncbi:hypothetical protein ACCC88_20375, partial [Sphingomonas sp. Sphisp140]
SLPAPGAPRGAAYTPPRQIHPGGAAPLYGGGAGPTPPHAKATKSLETKLAKADAKLAERAAAAEAELTEARTKALGEVEAIAADVASDLVEQLTGKRPTAADAAKAARAVAG